MPDERHPHTDTPGLGVRQLVAGRLPVAPGQLMPRSLMVSAALSLVQFGTEGGRWHAVETPERAGEVGWLAVADLSRYLAHLDCELG